MVEHPRIRIRRLWLKQSFCVLLVGVALLTAQPCHAQEPKAIAPAATEPAIDPPAGGLRSIAQPRASSVMGRTPVAQESVSLPVRAALPHDLSPWGMFLAADIVVKGVMIGLAFASVLVWTVWLVKTVEILTAGARLKQALSQIVGQRSLAEARVKMGRRGDGDTASQCLAAAENELDLSDGIPDPDGIERRTASRIADIETKAIRAARTGTGLIATIGATAPFVGLFGTVWGIMNSFVGISKAQTTNLAIVAPGIAEALLATAIGLVAAIPAVILYNQLARATAAYRALVRELASEILRLLSRDLARAAHAQSEHKRAAE